MNTIFNIGQLIRNFRFGNMKRFSKILSAILFSWRKYEEKYPELDLGDQNPFFNGNAFVVHLIPPNKKQIEKSDILSANLFADSRQDAFIVAQRDIKTQDIFVDLDKYEIVITNGIGLPWSEERE